MCVPNYRKDRLNITELDASKKPFVWEMDMARDIIALEKKNVALCTFGDKADGNARRTVAVAFASRCTCPYSASVRQWGLTASR